jgi:CO dehydrogenase maturation factor
MKIAFVGKWGSGKTTLTSFFIRYLLKLKNIVIAIDGDINVWLGEWLWIDFDREKYISKITTSEKIRKKLIGKNTKIISSNHFVKTTPPATWSYLIRANSEDFFSEFCSYSDPLLKFFHVGTYEKEWIGTSCYHTNLSILENIISHSHLDTEEYMIVDMVAGNDSFSNTLHSQFDLICLVVEPTIESVAMVANFCDLANHSDRTSPILLIGNKIEDQEDIDYLLSEWIHVDFAIPYKKSIKIHKRNKDIFQDIEIENIFPDLLSYIHKNIQIDNNKRLQSLYILHQKYIELDYIKSPLGDLSSHIDLDFHL